MERPAACKRSSTSWVPASPSQNSQSPSFGRSSAAVRSHRARLVLAGRGRHDAHRQQPPEAVIPTAGLQPGSMCSPTRSPSIASDGPSTRSMRCAVGVSSRAHGPRQHLVAQHHLHLPRHPGHRVERRPAHRDEARRSADGVGQRCGRAGSRPAAGCCRAGALEALEPTEDQREAVLVEAQRLAVDLGDDVAGPVVQRRAEPAGGEHHVAARARLLDRLAQAHRIVADHGDPAHDRAEPLELRGHVLLLVSSRPPCSAVADRQDLRDHAADSGAGGRSCAPRRQDQADPVEQDHRQRSGSSRRARAD